MNEPLLTLGSLYLTPFSLATFIGAELGALWLLKLCAKRRIQAETGLLLIILTVFLGLMCGHIVFAALQLHNDPFSYDAPIVFLLNPSMGGFSFAGVLIGAALAALITSKCRRASFDDLMKVLLPGLMLTLTVVRFAELTEELGKGPEAASTFFPLSYAPNPDYPESRRVPVFFYEALVSLYLCVRGSLGKSPYGWRKSLIIFLAAQLFFEVLRQDIFENYMSLITFVRVNQLFYVVMLAAMMLRQTIRAARLQADSRPLVLSWALFCVCVGACVGLQFLFDKPMHLFGENIFFADWVVYVLLALTSVGMGWSALRLLKAAQMEEV